MSTTVRISPTPAIGDSAAAKAVKLGLLGDVV
jgi:hypothetical protein